MGIRVRLRLSVRLRVKVRLRVNVRFRLRFTRKGPMISLPSVRLSIRLRFRVRVRVLHGLDRRPTARFACSIWKEWETHVKK